MDNDGKWRWEERLLAVLHNKTITFKLPNLTRIVVNSIESVANKMQNIKLRNVMLGFPSDSCLMANAGND